MAAGTPPGPPRDETVSQDRTQGSTSVPELPNPVASPTGGNQDGQDDSEPAGDGQPKRRQSQPAGGVDRESAQGAPGREGQNERNGARGDPRDQRRGGSADSGAPSDVALDLEVDGDLEHFTVDPSEYAPLRRAKCGPCESRGEKEVREMTRAYVKAQRRALVFRVTAMLPSKLVGYAAIAPANFKNPQLHMLNGYPLIDLISLHEPFRGKRKHGRRLGDHVLDDAIASIESNPMWPKGIDIVTLVDPRNKASRELFGRHEFQLLGDEPPPEDTENDCLFWLPARAPLNDESPPTRDG